MNNELTILHSYTAQSWDATTPKLAQHNHSTFYTKSTLLQHLNHSEHQPTFHLSDHSICLTIAIYSCCFTTCPTSFTQYFQKLNQLEQNNLRYHISPLSTESESPTLHNPQSQPDIVGLFLTNTIESTANNL